MTVETHALGQNANRGSRTQLLVSVRNCEEALAAVEGGADWIDLKEPRSGPLGAVEAANARMVVQAVSGQCPVSAAMGELVDWPNPRAIELLQIEAIEVVKLGLAECRQTTGWQNSWKAAARYVREAGKQLAAVGYADWQKANAPVPREFLTLARECGSAFFLLDTYDKTAGSVMDLIRFDELSNLLHEAQNSGFTTVVAGKLTEELLKELPLNWIDVVGVRSAVCGGLRTEPVNRDLVNHFLQAIEQLRFDSGNTTTDVVSSSQGA